MKRLLNQMRRLKGRVRPWRSSAKESGTIPGLTATTGESKPSELTELYRAANSAYHAGVYDEAMTLFRELVSIDPGFPKARAKLAGLLQHRGIALERSEDLEGATAVFREAHRWGPKTKKLDVRLARVLRKQASDALTADDAFKAHRLLREAVEIRPKDEGSRRLLNRLLKQIPHLPGGYFTEYAGPPEQGLTDLVFVEWGVDPDLMGAYLRHFDGAALFSETRLPAARLKGLLPTAILDVGTVGLEEDYRLCAVTDSVAEEIRSLARSILPHSLRAAGNLDLLDLLSFRFDDFTFGTGRKLRLLADLLASGRYGRVVFLLSTGDFAEGASAYVTEMIGADRIFHMWCSPSLERYDQRATQGPMRARSGWLHGRRGARRLIWNKASAQTAGSGDTGRVGETRPIVLLASPSAAHVENVTPVLQSLGESHDVRVVIPQGMRGAPVFGRLEALAGREPDRFRLVELSPPPPSWRSRLERWRLRRVVRRLNRLAATRGIFLEERPFWPALRRDIDRLVGDGIPRLREFIASFESLIAAWDPAALIVAPDRTPHARAACSLARASGIPSVFPQALLVAPSPRLKPLQADYVTVLDDITADLFVRHFDAEPQQVRITGIPRFKVPLPATREDEKRVGGLGALPKRRGVRQVALILQRFSPQETAGLIEAVAGAMSPLDDVRLRVKMHPGDVPGNRRRYADVLREVGFPHDFEVVQDGDARDVIAAASLVVAVFSNVVLEAAIMGRLVLCLNLTGSPLPVPFVEQGVAIGASTAREVREVLPRCLEDPAFVEEAHMRRDAYFSKNPHLIDGKAAMRVAAFVRELATLDGGSGSGESRGA